MATLQFSVSQNLYLRNPNDSVLGRKIISESIKLINQLGFEHFTFKKLARAIGSTEASVYRYFENKHRLLLYLIDWYWLWMDYRFEVVTQNLREPRERLNACLKALIASEPTIAGKQETDLQALKNVVMAEFEKTYLTKHVDRDNREGVFLPYKTVCRKLAALVSEINPGFPFPHTLISTVLLTANHQLFYAEHLPSLTDISKRNGQRDAQLEQFLQVMIYKTIEP